jgi:DNA processing protein
MDLRVDQIVKILQLKKLGRRTAFKLCERALNEVIDHDDDLMDFIRECRAKKWVPRLPEYHRNDFIDAFEEGESILEHSDNNNIKLLSYYDNDFPQSLKGIKDPPIVLNFKGDYKQLKDLTGIAIIGTREPTDEGVKSGEFFGKYFGEQGFNIVSGLAKGCDSAAHRGCVKSGGVTTAIVAHGLHTIYPKENFDLSEEILATGGIILSEYFIGIGALPNYFVERDRLQAGLSSATIVIQTAEKGGTMHAVDATVEGNKLLAAVQYKEDLNSDKVQGNKMLIRERDAFALTSNNKEEFIDKLKSIPNDGIIKGESPSTGNIQTKLW